MGASTANLSRAHVGVNGVPALVDCAATFPNHETNEGLTMRIGMPLPYSETLISAIDQLGDHHRAGVQIVYVAEVYTFDAVSTLGYIAAKVPGMEIASNILPLYTRTPSLLAMTAASLDTLSGGRFTLGLGSSGPQVIEGFHGVPFDAPIGRTRDIIEICRQVWRRERVQFESPRYQVPLTPERGGSGLGKPLKLINTPVRDSIPVLIAAMGPKNVRLAAELAQGWAPFFFRPEGYQDVWGEPLREGFAKRAADLGDLDVTVPVAVMVGDDVEGVREFMRPQFALYIGGMGARGQNFYFDLAVRYGYGKEAEQIQNLYLDGKKDEAAALVPADLLKSVSLIGPESFVAERMAAFAEAGVTTLAANLLAPTHPERVATSEFLARTAAGLTSGTIA
jgi:F420-dependent oxidoreductase-like protein